MRLNIKKPIVIRQKYIPAKGFKAINLFGIIFAKENAILDDKSLNHETIHTNQIIEMTMLYLPILIYLSLNISLWLIPTILLPYYVPYLVEWFIKFLYYNFSQLFKTIFRIKNKEEYDLYWAYKNISFEREAYDNGDNLEYLENRKFFSWVKYLF